MATHAPESEPSARAARPLRVALYEPSGQGGICHYTYQLAQALARRGCEVTVLTRQSWELERLPRDFQVRYLFLPSQMKRLVLGIAAALRLTPRGDGTRRTARSRARLWGWLKVVRLRFTESREAAWLASRHYDLVHLHSVGLGGEQPLLRALRRFRLPVVCTAHEALPHESASPSQLEALGAVYADASRIIVHAERTRQQLVGLFPIDSEKVEVIPQGSFEFLFPGVRISREAARQRLGLPPHRPTILFFGLIRRYKGLEYLVEAFDRIEAELPDAVLAIVGSLFRGDAAAHAYYSRLLEGLSRRPNVRRVEGYVPLEEVGSYFCAADVVAIPYTETSQSAVLLTALAAGRPVVVTDTGGLSETVTDGSTGFVVPVRDSSALAHALLRILKSPELAEAMGRNGVHQAETTYSWDRIAEQTIRLYSSVISE